MPDREILEKYLDFENSHLTDKEKRQVMINYTNIMKNLV